MRRFRFVMLLAAVGSGALFVSCSKKAAAPTAPPAAVCTVSPTTLDFGTVPAGGTATRSFTIWS